MNEVGAFEVLFSCLLGGLGGHILTLIVQGQREASDESFWSDKDQAKLQKLKDKYR